MNIKYIQDSRIETVSRDWSVPHEYLVQIEKKGSAARRQAVPQEKWAQIKKKHQIDEAQTK